MNSTPTEFESTLLYHSSNPIVLKLKSKLIVRKLNAARRRIPAVRNQAFTLWELVGFYVSVVISIALVIWVGLKLSDNLKKLTLFKPDVNLESLFICPTDISNNVVIWDLKFDFTNTNNYSDFFITPLLKVSVFPYNQTKLLTMAVATNYTFVEPKSHESSVLLSEDSSYDDLNGLLDPITGTIRLDLKIRTHFYFGYLAFGACRGAELVCGDVKVNLSSSSNSSCGSMVSDLVACSYESYDSTRFSFWDTTGFPFGIQYD